MRCTKINFEMCITKKKNIFSRVERAFIMRINLNERQREVVIFFLTMNQASHDKMYSSVRFNILKISVCKKLYHFKLVNNLINLTLQFVEF